MATAQQLFVDQFITLINTNTNMNSDVIASSPSAGLLRITQKGTADPIATYLAGGSSVSGAGTFVSRPVTGSPKYAELYFSWTLQPGDTVKLNAGVAGRTLDLTYNMPLGTAVDAGGLDHTTVGGGGGGGVLVGGGGVGSAQNRRLVVMECGAASTSFGSLFALDPQDATGIPIPTFRVVTSLPAAGSQAGESVYVTATRQGYVWDGTAWRDITASPIRSFASDSALQANTTEPVGTYAVASDTGNMYVKTAADGWRRIGVAEFATYADLNAWDAALGTEAISRDMDVMFLRVDDQAGGEKWIPISQLVKTEAQILAAPNVAGLAAIASDTGATYVNNGTRWIQDPIEHYPTEADLLAATPIEGHLAWADDTQVVYIATGAAWKRLQGPQISVGTTEPAVKGTGDMWMVTNGSERGLKVFDGTDADPANHGWRDADRNPVMYVGAGAFNTGAVNEAGNWGMPANTVPSPANVMPQPDDQYLDVQTGIFKRLTGPALPAGGATPASPIDSSITGATQIGDITPRVPTYQRIVGDQYTTSDHIIELTQNCTEWIEMWGFVQCGVNFTAIPRVKFAGALWDFTNTSLNQHAFSLCQYTADGVSDSGSGYLTTHKAGLCYRNTANYDARENHPLLFTVKATRMGAYWMFRIDSTFKSGNDTPMTFSSGWQTTKNTNITGIGVKTYNYQGTAEQPGPYCLNVSYL